MKKKLVAMLAFAFICQVGYSQKNVKQLFDEFSKYENTTKVNIGKIAMTFAGFFQNTMGVDGIEVIALEDCAHNVKEQFNNAVRSLKDTSFDTLVNTSENGQRTKVLIQIKDDVIREIVVLTSGNDAAMVRIKGKIKKSDIEKVVNKNS